MSWKDKIEKMNKRNNLFLDLKNYFTKISLGKKVL